MADIPHWDPYNAEQRRSPYEAWRRLRDEAPVYHNEQYGFYALSRFDDVYAASLDTATFSSTGGTTLDMIGKPLGKEAAAMMIHMDPPQHDALRSVVARAFTPRRIADLEHRIRELCAGYLDPFVGSPGFDYVREFTMKLPVMVISTLLGYPEADHDQLREWSDLMLYREEGKEGTTRESIEAQLLSIEYAGRQVAVRRAEPADDMISALIGSELTEPDGTVRPLTDLEIMSMLVLISSAGNETVARLLGWAAVVLDDFPDERAAVAADPTLSASAVEELLRFEAPSPTQGRMTLHDVELHGVTIPAGVPVGLLTGSAGRDERKYPDPDRFDVRRSFDRHLSLGYGAHYCLGAALARLEGRIGASTPDPGNAATVAVIGGTTAHDLVSDAGAALARELSQSRAFVDKQVHVVNLAVPGYRQPQQLSLVLFLLAAGAQFDAIINLDGGPDLSSVNLRADGRGDSITTPAGWRTLTSRVNDPGVVERIGLRMVLKEDREQWVRRCTGSWWSSFALARVVCRRQTDTLNRMITELEPGLERARTAPPARLGPSYAPHEIHTALKDLARLWQRSSQLIHQVCERQGIPYFHFLQPLAANKDAKPLTLEEQALIGPSVAGPQTAFLKVAQKAARYLGKQLRTQGVSFHDLTMIFAGHQQTLYVDSCCRLNPQASEILAEAIGSAVATSMDTLP